MTSKVLPFRPASRSIARTEMQQPHSSKLVTDESCSRFDPALDVGLQAPVVRVQTLGAIGGEHGVRRTNVSAPIDEGDAQRRSERQGSNEFPYGTTDQAALRKRQAAWTAGGLPAGPCNPRQAGRAGSGVICQVADMFATRVSTFG
jgi:hypothetical protein